MKYRGPMKNSGVEWLGEVPEHWVSQKLSLWISGYGSGTTPRNESDYSEVGIPWVTTGELRENIITHTHHYVTADTVKKYSALKIHPAKSLIIAMYGATIGRVGILGIPATLNQACFAIHPNKNITIDFLNYCLQCFRTNLITMATGAGQPNISADKIRSLKIAAPLNALEQSSITIFLDHETSKVDTLISEQQKLITLLTEKRQAIISHAVTKGLDPDVLMKDSSIAWLGKVPKYWKIERLKFSIKLNPSKSEIMPFSENIEVSFLPMDTIGDDGSLCLKYTRLISDVKDGYTYFRNGDVTLAKITPCFENGKGAIMRDLHNGYGFGTTELIVARPNLTRITEAYLHYIFISSPFRKIGEGTMYGSGGQKRLSDDFVKNFIIALPPIEEQLTITTFLDCETSKINNLITEVNRAIELLKERRTALISAAVTGKIDVRDINPNLPMESSPDVQFTPGTTL